MWYRGGFIPPGHDAQLEIVRRDREAQIWFGDHAVPAAEREIQVLGTLLGSDAFVQAQLQATGEAHEFLLSRIPIDRGPSIGMAPSRLCASTSVRPTICGCVIQSIPCSLQTSTTLACGNVSAVFWVNRPRVGLVCEAPVARPTQPKREVGQNVWAPVGRDTPTSPKPWWKFWCPFQRVPSTGLVRHPAEQHVDRSGSPSWLQLFQGLRPEQPVVAETEPGVYTDGSSLPRTWKSVSGRKLCGLGALPRSKRSSVPNLGPHMSGLPFSAVPSALFRFAVSGFLARDCSEAGACVSTNVCVRDLDLQWSALPLFAEVGGRWSEEARTFAWQHRWASFGVCECPRVCSFLVGPPPRR